ncbi:MAG: amino acid adenylation domain-containing protein [Acidobacteria bacterium]|nr:amino acid adenylation domain-containing protein [Acidobacteriota bacterium]
MNFKSLIAGFLESVERFPSRAALFVDGEQRTYAELHQLANAIASAIQQRQETPWPLAAILAYRSLTAYAGVLGTLEAGKGYVPLNPKFPLERTRKMLDLSGCSVLIVGRESASLLPGLLADFPRRLTVILPDTTDAAELVAGFPDHEFVPAPRMAQGSDVLCPPAVEPGAVAYLLFTSGSTGEPKGVPISNLNVRSYVDYTCNRYEVTQQDRFSQEFDMTFDLSVHDMFVCWERGACLYSVPDKATMLPAKFIRDHELTMWFSVPSVAGVLARTRLLQPGSFPSLRYSLFCGEPLSAKYAQLWQEAAPQSVVENLYGPTEATIAISQYRWDGAKSPEECYNGIVPIGWIFKGQQCRVIDTERNLLPPGELGELCLGGSQVTSGYWNNPQKTQEQLIRLPATGDTVWYRTGDLVRQREDGCLIYLGRVDQQVKIRGYRVELQEIEGVLRKYCGAEQVVAVPWPVINGTADGVVAFVSGVATIDSNRVLASCRQTLPDYMVPQKIHVLEEMPWNANGKIDRLKLKQMLGGTS